MERDTLMKDTYTIEDFIDATNKKILQENIRKKFLIHAKKKIA